MATMVYQGSQSCLRSHLTETRALRLRLSSPSPHFPHQFPLEPSSYYSESAIAKETGDKNDTANCSPQDKHDVGRAQSFLQALSCTTPISKDTAIYIHPLAKRSSSVVLSEKSLALCTENLGNETGTDAMETTDTFLPISSSEKEEEEKKDEAGKFPTKEAVILQQGLKSRRRNVGDGKPNFPPPLTTLSGGRESIQVRPHRENGRLVIQATMAPSKRHCFQAERCNGRLRLCLFGDYSTPCDFYSEKETHLKSDKEEVEEEKEGKQGMREKIVMGGRCVEAENGSEGLFKRELYLVSTS